MFAQGEAHTSLNCGFAFLQNGIRCGASQICYYIPWRLICGRHIISQFRKSSSLFRGEFYRQAIGRMNQFFGLLWINWFSFERGSVSACSNAVFNFTFGSFRPRLLHVPEHSRKLHQPRANLYQDWNCLHGRNTSYLRELAWELVSAPGWCSFLGLLRESLNSSAVTCSAEISSEDYKLGLTFIYHLLSKASLLSQLKSWQSSLGIIMIYGSWYNQPDV